MQSHALSRWAYGRHGCSIISEKSYIAVGYVISFQMRKRMHDDGIFE